MTDALGWLVTDVHWLPPQEIFLKQELMNTPADTKFVDYYFILRASAEHRIVIL